MTTFFAYCIAGAISACYLLAMHTVALRRTRNGTDRPRDKRRIRVIAEHGRGPIALLFAAAWPLVLVTWAWVRLTEDRDDDDPQSGVPPQYR